MNTESQHREQALLAEISDSPGDNRQDGPKGIYADWLDDQGRTQEAEWVRIAAAEMNHTWRPQGIPLVGGTNDGKRAMPHHYGPFIRLVKEGQGRPVTAFLTDTPYQDSYELETYRIEVFNVFGQEFAIYRIERHDQ